MERDVAVTPVEDAGDKLSPWWRNAVVLVLVLGFTILVMVTANTYKIAPPIPAQIVGENGATLLTSADILGGQQVFLKYGLMENGTLWGHGAYLGPDFSAEYLHTLSIDAATLLAQQQYNKPLASLSPTERAVVDVQVQQSLKQNRYDAATGTLTYSPAQAASFQQQINKWTEYFATPSTNGGLPAKLITDPTELRQLTAFFSWSAWAAAANRPGRTSSYTSNFPYDPAAGNVPPTDAFLWSALSLIALLGGTAAVLFIFGRFSYLGWRGGGVISPPQMTPGKTTPSQRATLKYFVVAALLMVVQALVGMGVAHYRADPGSFYGIDISTLLPSNILRTWHLQLAIFWIATCFVAGAALPGACHRARRAQESDALACTSCLLPWCWSWWAACWVNTWVSTMFWAACGSGWATRAGNSSISAASGRCSWRSACCSGYFCSSVPSIRHARTRNGARYHPFSCSPQLPSRSSTCRPCSSIARPTMPSPTFGVSGSFTSGSKASSSCL